MAKTKDVSPPSSGSSPSAASDSGHSSGTNVSGSAASNYENHQGQGQGQVAEYFPLGAEVELSLASGGERVQGQVMAFDPQQRMLCIKSVNTTKRGHGLHDVTVVNLNLVGDLKILNEPKDNKNNGNGAAVNDPPELIVSMLRKRVKKNVDMKKRMIKAFKSGISPDGQALFQTISKTFDEIDWNGDNIVLGLNTTIVPPYRPENVKGHVEKEVGHVRKIVEKHYENRVSPDGLANLSLDDSGKTSAPSSTPGTPNGNGSLPKPAPSSSSSNTPSSAPQQQGGGAGKRNSKGPQNSGSSSRGSPSTRGRPQNNGNGILGRGGGRGGPPHAMRGRGCGGPPSWNNSRGYDASPRGNGHSSAAANWRSQE